jgi:hypothetical protein
MCATLKVRHRARFRKLGDMTPSLVLDTMVATLAARTGCKEPSMPNALPRTTLTLLLIAGACAALPLSIMAQQQPSSASEQALKPERNPPGDIPDNQVFIDYISPLGFSLKVPEGWARQDLPDGVSFADKYGRIAVAETAAPKMPSVEEAKQMLLPELEKSSRAVAVAAVKPVKLPAGPAIRISYGSNSDPNPVTNKAIRLENDRYYFWKDGKLVSVNFSAPAGADNADQWDMMATTFRWR